jgi:lantibiotic modifying enzyme
VTAILTSGKNLASKSSEPSPLMFEWHEKKYLGAAHGIAGILFVLLQVYNINFFVVIIKALILQSLEYLPEDRQEDVQNLTCGTLDFLLSTCFPSGNFPSSIGNNSDRLVHWCHGAPAFVPVLCCAYKVF